MDCETAVYYRYSESRIEMLSCSNAFVGHLFHSSPIKDFEDDEKRGNFIGLSSFSPLGEKVGMRGLAK